MKSFCIGDEYSSVPFEFRVKSTHRLANGDFDIILDEGALAQLEWSEVDFPVDHITATKKDDGTIWIVICATAEAAVYLGRYQSLQIVQVYGLEGLKWNK